MDPEYENGQPQFPYSDDVEEEYNNNKDDDPKWVRDYPLTGKNGKQKR